MKKLQLIAGALLICAAGNAQSLTDGFESYTVGNYLGSESSNWETWSGVNGGADDVQIVDDLANGGDNAIYFEAASAAGGPDDVVLPFGGQYTTGNFTYEMMIYVASGSGAYWNFQANTTVGQEWAFECTMNQYGDIDIANTNGPLLTGSYTTGQWVELSFEIDLNQNEWEFFVDGSSQGSFSNTINKVAALNIYAYNNTNGGNGSAIFWVDDVSYEYTSAILPDDNGALTGINPVNGLVGQAKKPTVMARNLGVNDITSFDVDLTYNGTTITESVTGVSLASYDEYAVEFTDAVTLVAGSNMMTATIKNVNGAASDDDSSDDDASTTVDPTAPGLNKMVVVEEATGTWCGWCPRGAVWMEYMQETYPENFIGLAVHNGDPMVYAEYDDGIGTLIGGYPSSLVDRGGDIDPSVMEGDFLDRVVLDASAELCLSASLDETEEEMTVTLMVTPTSDFDDSWRVAVALSENGVTGTGSQFAQANYYSGGASGELSGAGHDWHNAANPVSANDMVYDHVARMIEPSFNGLEDAFPDGGEIAETYTFEFTIDVSNEWDLDHLHVIGMLMDGNGLIDNGAQVDYNDALSIECGVPTVGLNDVVRHSSDDLKVYPNPASNMVNINADLKAGVDNQIVVRDVMGRVVFNQTISDQAGLYQVNLDISKINSGVYIVEMTSGSSIVSAKFIKQ